MAMMRTPPRVRILLAIAAILTATVWIVARLLVFKQIFFQHSGIAITQTQVAELFDYDKETRAQLIPKIIHQVFHNWHDPGNDTLPSDWRDVRQTCIDTNPDWEYNLWTEETSRNFIETEYPWFLRTYDRYRYPVQRVDAVRYFLLMHYGGIYLDLDNGCKTDLTPLLYYPLWVTDGGRGALSNNILASRPHHPYWTRITSSLMRWDINWIFPYVTISYASGQWFETAIWEQYHQLLPRPEDNTELEHRLYRLMMDDREGADPWVFFTQARGGTWVNWDNRLFLWVGDHLFVVLLVVVSSAGVGTWVCLRLLRARSGWAYRRLDDEA